MRFAVSSAPARPRGRSRAPGVGPARFVVVAACAIVLTAGGASGWITALDGDAPPRDEGRAVAFDGAGNVLTAGILDELGLGRALTVVKTDPGGVELWRQRLSGTVLRSEGGAVAGGLSVDAAGDVIVSGGVLYLGRLADFFVAKLDGETGAERWRRAVDGPAGGSDVATCVTVDPAGDVLAGGRVAAIAGGTNAFVVKLDGTSGDTRWARVFDGTADSSGDAVRGVAVDGIGRVSVAMTLVNATTGSDFTLVGLSGTTGATLWGPRRIDTGDASAHAAAVTVDADDDVVAAGGGDDFIVVKLSPTGVERWRVVLDGSSHARDEANAVAVDAAGDVVAVGSTDNVGSGQDFTLVKLSGSDGTQLWSRHITGTADDTDVAEAVAVDAGRNVVAAGRTRSAETGDDFTVVRYSSSGVIGWLLPLHRPGSERESAAAVAVGPGGAVAAAGTVWSAVTGADLHQVLLDGAAGTFRWERTLDGTGHGSEDSAQAVAADPAGHVLAAGTIHNAASGRDFTVVALDGATGTLRWRAAVTGDAPGGHDAGSTLTLDAAADVLAGGSTESLATGEDFTVVKLSGADGRERWRRTISGSNLQDVEELARVVAVDARGDVVAAGKLGTERDVTSLFVTKLSAEAGVPLWETAISGDRSEFSEGANALALDGAQDVVVAGSLADDDRRDDFAVVALSGVTGAERWRFVLDVAEGRDSAAAVAVDAAGDVVAAGVLENEDHHADLYVVKLGATDGTVRWELRLDGAAPDSEDEARAVVVDPAGDVLVAGRLEVADGVYEPLVLKLAGATGAERWRSAIPVASGDGNAVTALALDAAGDVVAVGALATARALLPFSVLKLAGASGGEMWRRAIGGTANAVDRAAAVVLDGAGNVAVAGRLVDAGTGSDLTIVKISGATGGDAFCGDGVHAAGERCDDGNAAGGDCCSPTCEPTVVAGVCEEACAGVADCDDADPCTLEACDETSHCRHEAVSGREAVTCAFGRELGGPGCTEVPRKIRRRFERAGRVVRQAVDAASPRRRQRLYRLAAHVLAGVARQVDRAERRGSRRGGIAPECAAALRAIVGDARSRVEAVRGLGRGGAELPERVPARTRPAPA